MTIKDLIKTFSVDQKEMFDILNENSKYQFRVPTGVGKGYVMMVHILNSVMNADYSKFVISSHRLSLNNQHLRDLIDFYVDLNLVSKIKFLSVGSQALSINKLLSDDYELAKKFNNQLFEYNFEFDIKNKITQSDIFQSTLSKRDVNKIIKKNDKNGFKTIIITTYNSLDKLKDQEIDTIYLDEAHILASEKEDADFKNSYQLINSKKSFFFTATPKDVEEQLLESEGGDDIFLMNNKEIFGDIYQIPFVKCVKSGYIAKPIIHIAHPKEMIDDKDYNSIENKSKFVKETFESHRNWLKSISSTPDEIEAKILVRCESVPHMWSMYEMLSAIMPSDVIICAGASYNADHVSNHVISGEWESNRDEFVNNIQNIPDDRKVIILNYDIFSEGINVPGITGVMFLQGKMPSIAKVIQNIGRSTRLHRIDRDRIRKGEISTDNYGEWVKPNCAVIIPYWDSSSEFTKKILADVVRKLRDSWEFDPHFIVSIGDDFANSDPEEDIDDLNKKDKKDKNIKLIEEICNEIESLDKEDLDLVERERIQNLSESELFDECFVNKK